MATAEPKKSGRRPVDMEGLQSEVASFASSLGFVSSAAPATGFDDSDFRKTGPLKPPKPSPPSPDRDRQVPSGGKGPKQPKGRLSKPNPLEHIDPFGHDGGGAAIVAKAANGKTGVHRHPKLSLMRASSPLGPWYEELEELEGKVLPSGAQRRTSVLGLQELKRLVERKEEVAERLMAQYAEDYEEKTKSHGDWRLVRMAARSGTTSDKVTALATLVGDNPVANLKSLDILLGLVDAKVGKRYAFKGFDHLSELFKTRLLPDRKLKCLLQRPVDILPESIDGFSLLLFWYYEECLKKRYERFVVALEAASKDMLPSLKDIAMKLIYGLLRSKMERERKLLYALVNKLGDPLRKTASTAGYYLTCLLSDHPNMKLVVIEEVDSFIFRPHMGLRAKYHAVNFLSQTLLSRRGDGPKVAKKLVDIYFALFKVLISSGQGDTKSDVRGKKLKNGFKHRRKGIHDDKSTFREESRESCVEMDSRILCALLTGVNRAFPFVSSDDAENIIEVQTPILFRLVHSTNFNVALQALTLLYQISAKNQILSDRFYRALYAKLLLPAALNSSKHEMFLGLLFKAMKADLNVKRLSAFSKRLLQVSLQQPPQYACGCLCLISEVLKARPHLWTTMLQIESVDEDLEHFEDIKEDREIGDVAPCESTKSFDTPDNLKVNVDSDSKNLLNSLQSVEDSLTFCNKVKSSSGDAMSDITNGAACSTKGQPSSLTSSVSMKYDPRHREPAYCNAETASWWELTLLASHVHPSVAAMAQTLLSGVSIVYNGDPLNDLSLAAFLDKFMEKKPKVKSRAEAIWHGGSQIAPARKLDIENRLIGEEILELAEDEVAPEDVIFHKFYSNKTSITKRKKKKKQKSLAEDEAADELLPGTSDDGEEDEDEVDDMFGLGQLASEDRDGDYDYDDLDKVAVEDEEELLGHVSDDDEADSGYGGRSEEEEELDAGGVGDGDRDSGGDSASDMEPKTCNGKKRKSRESPFVCLEDYERDKGRFKKMRKKPMSRKKSSG